MQIFNTSASGFRKGLNAMRGTNLFKAHGLQQPCRSDQRVDLARLDPTPARARPRVFKPSRSVVADCTENVSVGSLYVSKWKVSWLSLKKAFEQALDHGSSRP